MAVLGSGRPEGTVLLTRHLIVLSVLAAVAISANAALAQGGFPAPLPGQAVSPTDPPAPKAIIGAPAPFFSAGIASSAPSPCTKDFAPLREDAEEKGKLIREARDRHAPPDEACKIVGNYSAAEAKMIKYVEINAARCGIPDQVASQLKAGHKNTEGLLQKVCGIAEQTKARGSAGPSLKQVLDPTTRTPEGRPAISDFGDPAFGPVGRERFR